MLTISVTFQRSIKPGVGHLVTQRIDLTFQTQHAAGLGDNVAFRHGHPVGERRQRRGIGFFGDILVSSVQAVLQPGN